MDWSKSPSFGEAASGGETKWVSPEKYFDQLGEEAMYSQFGSLSKVANRDPEIKKIITEVAQNLDETLIVDFLQWKYNGKPAGNNWNRSQHNHDNELNRYSL